MRIRAIQVLIKSPGKEVCVGHNILSMVSGLMNWTLQYHDDEAEGKVKILTPKWVPLFYDFLNDRADFITVNVEHMNLF